MRQALADRILLSLNMLRKANISSYFPSVIAFFSSYFFSAILKLGIASSYYSLLPVSFLMAVSSEAFLRKQDGVTDDFKKPLQLKDSVESLGGDGPRVAAYLRVSTSRQAKEGFSLEAQYEQLNKMKNELKPSQVYWFVDAGKSGVNFDKRKITIIAKLKEKGEIQELWVTNIDRIGRECRKLLYFFLEFCDDGAIIRTPQRTYVLKDLSSFLMLVIEAHTSEQANKSRAAAAVAGKAHAFKQKRWNKPVPLGYLKKVWLQKSSDWEPLVKEAYSFFARERSIEATRRKINERFRRLLSEPLSRSRIKRILSDPVYVGRPEHLGDVVVDHSLAFVGEDEFRKSQEILARNRKRYQSYKRGPMEKLATTQPITVLEFLSQFERRHRSCGGLVVKNGTTKDEGIWQQLLICNKCGTEWRFPLLKHQNKKGSNHMGGLVFDSVSSKCFKRVVKAKENRMKRRNQNGNLTKSLLDYTYT